MKGDLTDEWRKYHGPVHCVVSQQIQYRQCFNDELDKGIAGFWFDKVADGNKSKRAKFLEFKLATEIIILKYKLFSLQNKIHFLLSGPVWHVLQAGKTTLLAISSNAEAERDFSQVGHSTN